MVLVSYFFVLVYYFFVLVSYFFVYISYFFVYISHFFVYISYFFLSPSAAPGLPHPPSQTLPSTFFPFRNVDSQLGHAIAATKQLRQTKLLLDCVCQPVTVHNVISVIILVGIVGIVELVDDQLFAPAGPARH